MHTTLKKDPISERQNRSGTSKKLVRFDEENTRVKNLQKIEIVELEAEEDISETSYVLSKNSQEGYGKALSSRGKLNDLSKKQVKTFLMSKRKEAKRSRSPGSLFDDSESNTLGVGSVVKISRDKNGVAIEVQGDSSMR